MKEALKASVIDVFEASFFVPSFFDYLHFRLVRIMNTQVKPEGRSIK